MRGGLAIERSKQEALRLKMQFMVKHRKMSERRARVVKTIKAEYFEDFREKQYENRARNARAKSNHLAMASTPGKNSFRYNRERARQKNRKIC